MRERRRRGEKGVTNERTSHTQRGAARQGGDRGRGWLVGCVKKSKTALRLAMLFPRKSGAARVEREARMKSKHGSRKHVSREVNVLACTVGGVGGGCSPKKFSLPGAAARVYSKVQLNSLNTRFALQFALYCVCSLLIVWGVVKRIT